VTRKNNSGNGNDVPSAVLKIKREVEKIDDEFFGVLAKNENSIMLSL
jgi:hypothetical protein